MRPAENIKRLIKNAKIKINPEVKRAALKELINELEKSKITSWAGTKPNIWRIVARSRIAQTSVAAVIIIASCFFLTHQGQNGEIKTQQITQTVKSPAELTTLASLSFAYRQGGMEMVEQMCDKALKMAGPRPANISMEEFFEEINNGKSEGTKL